MAMTKLSMSACRLEGSAKTSLKFSGRHTSGQKVGIVRLVSAASFRAVMICQ